MRETEILEKKLRVFSKDYVPILGSDCSSLFYYLLSGENSFLFNRIRKEELSKLFNINIDKSLKILNECGLITRPTKDRNDDKYYTFNTAKEIKLLSKEEKLNLINKLFELGLYDKIIKEYREKTISELIVKEEKIKIEQNIEIKKHERKKRTVPNTPPHPDTWPGLINSYYHMISNKYGHVVKTSNYDKEAGILKNISKQNEDTPDRIREMFKWIIDNNKYDLICTLSLYPLMRKRAYHYLFGNQNKFEKIEYKSGEDELEFIKQAYDFYIEKGETKDIIVKKYLYPNYEKEQIDKFIDSLGSSNGE